MLLPAVLDRLGTMALLTIITGRSNKEIRSKIFEAKRAWGSNIDMVAVDP